MINNKFRTALIEKSSMFDRPEEDASIEPLRFVVISSEGTKTEPSYFNNLNDLLIKKQIGIRFLVLDHATGDNTPEKLVELLRECRTIQDNEPLISPALQEILEKELSTETIKSILGGEKNIDKKTKSKFKNLLLAYGIDIDFHNFLKKYNDQFDTFVVILDRDAKNHSIESLQNAHCICEKEGFYFCITNPCFEFWLFLHIWDKKALKKELYDKMLDNKRVSSTHTFMSKYLNSLTKHHKKIPKTKFLEYYATNIAKAIHNAEAFATDFQNIQNHLGTNLGIFLSSLEKKYAFLFSKVC